MSRKTRRNIGAGRVTDVSAIEADLSMAIGQLRAMAGQSDALAHAETFCAVALRVMSHTAPGVIKRAAMAEEMKAHLDGREVDGSDISRAWLDECAPMRPTAWAGLRVLEAGG